MGTSGGSARSTMTPSTIRPIPEARRICKSQRQANRGRTWRIVDAYLANVMSLASSVTSFKRVTLRILSSELMVLVALISAGGSLFAQQSDDRHGGPEPTRYDTPRSPRAHDVLYRDVAPILESRCVVCHGCYDAPCQLKLTAWEGIARGASADRVYDGTRLHAAPPSRLFEDAFKASSWRRKGFHPVLCERAGLDNIGGSVLAQMLLLKQQHPLPETKVLPETLDLSINRAQQCTTIEAFPAFAQKYPLWGMPFALPELDAKDRDLLLRWIEQGASRESDPPIGPELERQISRWESWLNADSPKRRLVARYVYEHLFLAHLYFGDDHSYFRLVRSRTPPGQAVDLIATRRPFDDPGVSHPYYRLVPLKEAVVSKTHMPYRLDEARMSLWRQLFVDPPFSVKALPGYQAQTASNPFITFADLPVRSRYRFMLDEAQFTIMGFIKGPVCRGQQALDVIDDYFWVFFNDPSLVDNTEQSQFLAANSRNLQLPAALESDAPVLRHWLSFAEGERRYLAARAALVKAEGIRTLPQGARLIWDGDSEQGHPNPNAALTVFRHFDSASVEQGLIGDNPQTAWIIGYPLLERLHYLLVAGYDVYGNIGHQLRSRLYMDFLRIEGEQAFLSLLPDDSHAAIEHKWYRDAPRWTLDYVAASHLPLGDRADLELAGLPPDQAYGKLLGRLRRRVDSALPHPFDLHNIQSDALREMLQRLAGVSGRSLQWLPQLVLVRLSPKDGEPVWLSLLNNSAHKNVAEIFFEDRRRLPDEDTLTVAKGFIGAYPNAFWIVDEAELPELTRRIATLAGEADYSALIDRFGVRRTNGRFWPLSDEAHLAMKKQDSVTFGLLDFNRLESR